MEHHHKPGLRVRLRITAARRRAWLSAGLHSACRKPPRRDPSDSVHKVARREIGGGHRRPPRPAAPSSAAFSCPEKFRNFQLQTNCHVPLTILSIEDGTPLKTFSQLLHRNRKVDFIEQFNEKLLVKQDKENLQIIDLRPWDQLT
nr:unnamed protein product [Digitaria exilis]